MSSQVEFKSWTKPVVGGKGPSARQGHACAVVANKAYVFGGSAVAHDGSPYFHNDLYSINLGDSDPRWTLLDPRGDIPGGRECSTLNSIGKQLFLWGGVDTDSSAKCLEGLYVFYTEKNMWKKMATTGTPPKAFSCSAASTSDKLITFGGVYEGAATNHTHMLHVDAKSLVWELAQVSGQKPKPRCDHGSTVVAGRLFVFGGSAGSNIWLNDLHMLDIELLEWTALGVIENAPPPRDYMGLLSVEDKLLVMVGGFSGCGGKDNCYSDMHFIYITDSSTPTRWTSADGEKAVLPPGRYSHCVGVVGTKILIFGGVDIDRVYDDLWVREVVFPKINYEPSVPPRRKYRTVTPIPAPRRNLSPVQPAKAIQPRDFEQLKSQYVSQIKDIFDGLTKKCHEVDVESATVARMREQLESEKKEQNAIYDKQQAELQEVLTRHKRENEEWVEKMRQEFDAQRKEIADQKAYLASEKEELEKEKVLFAEKSTKLDAIMRQVQGLATP